MQNGFIQDQVSKYNNMSNFTNTIKLTMINFPEENYIPAALIGVSIGGIIACTNYAFHILLRYMSGKLESDEIRCLNNALDESKHYGSVAQTDIQNLRSTIEHLHDELTVANKEIAVLNRKNADIMRILTHEHQD